MKKLLYNLLYMLIIKLSWWMEDNDKLEGAVIFEDGNSSVARKVNRFEISPTGDKKIHINAYSKER